MVTVLGFWFPELAEEKGLPNVPFETFYVVGCLVFISIAMVLAYVFVVCSGSMGVYHLMVGYGFGFGVSRVGGGKMFATFPL